MQKINTTAAVCLALLPALATPAAAQNREHLQLAAELRMLQEQNQQLSLALNQLAETLKAVNSRLDTSDEQLPAEYAQPRPRMCHESHPSVGALDTPTRARGISSVDNVCGDYS